MCRCEDPSHVRKELIRWQRHRSYHFLISFREHWGPLFSLNPQDFLIFLVAGKMIEQTIPTKTVVSWNFSESVWAVSTISKWTTRIGSRGWATPLQELQTVDRSTCYLRGVLGGPVWNRSISVSSASFDVQLMFLMILGDLCWSLMVHLMFVDVCHRRLMQVLVILRYSSVRDLQWYPWMRGCSDSDKCVNKLASSVVLGFLCFWTFPMCFRS
jgi:hypothetical protein